MDSPTERRASINRVSKIQARAALDEEPHHLFVARANGLMEWRGMGVEAIGIQAIRILTGIKKQANDPGVTMLSSESQRNVLVVGRGMRKETLRVVKPAQTRDCWKRVGRSAAPG